MSLHNARGKLLICFECGEITQGCVCNDYVLTKNHYKYSGKCTEE